MSRATRGVLLAYFVCLALSCVYVPWKTTIPKYGLAISRGYFFIWKPPVYVSGPLVGVAMVSVDVERIVLEIVSLTAVCAVAVLIVRVFRKSPAPK